MDASNFIVSVNRVLASDDRMLVAKGERDMVTCMQSCGLSAIDSAAGLHSYRAFANTVRPSVDTDDLHTDDVAVNEFAAMMKSRLADKRAAGYDGWDNAKLCDVTYLEELHRRAAANKRYLDAANFAMMVVLRQARAL